MAAEVAIIELIGKVPGCPVRYTCASSAITKGTVMRVTDPRTASAHSAADQPIVGIAAEDVTAASGATTVTLYTNGIFDITAAAAGVTTVGAIVACSGTANMTTAADAADMRQGSYVGQVLESQANDERCAVRMLK